MTSTMLNQPEINLNLGCGSESKEVFSRGNEVLEYWFGVDNRNDSYADVYYDLNTHPYLPFKDKSVSFILIKKSISYIENPGALLEECRRVAVDGIGIIPCYCDTCKNMQYRREWHRNYNRPLIVFLTQDRDRQKRVVKKFMGWATDCLFPEDLLPPDSKNIIGGFGSLAASRKYAKRLLKNIETAEASDKAYFQQCLDSQFDLRMFAGEGKA